MIILQYWQESGDYFTILARARWLFYNIGNMEVIFCNPEYIIYLVMIDSSRHWAIKPNSFWYIQQCFDIHNNNNNVLGHCVQCDWTSAGYKIQSSGKNSVNWSIFFLLEQSLFYSSNLYFTQAMIIIDFMISAILMSNIILPGGSPHQKRRRH